MDNRTLLTKSTMETGARLADLRSDYVRYLRTFSTDLPETDPSYIMSYDERQFCQQFGLALDDAYAYRMWLVSRLLHYEQAAVEEEVRIYELRQTERSAYETYSQRHAELKQLPFWQCILRTSPVIGQHRQARAAWQQAYDELSAARQHRDFLRQELAAVLEMAYSPHWLQRERRRKPKTPQPGSAEYRRMIEEYHQRFFGENNDNVVVQWAMNVYAELRQAERQ